MKRILLILLLCFYPFVFASAENEWNGAEANANGIALNSITTATLGNQWGLDLDYFTFTPSSNATTTFRVLALNPLEMTLIQNCASGSSTTLSTATSPNAITYNLVGGVKYCVKVSYPTQGADIAYILTLASNQAPVANAKFFSLAKNTPLSANLISQGGTEDSDPDGDTLSVTKKTSPLHGSVTLKANGDFVYTPVTDFTGTDSFVYTLSDGKGHSVVANVVIEVSNKHPLANDKNFGTAQNKTLSKNMMNDGGLVDSDPNGSTISIFARTKPAHGLLVFNKEGDFTYAPDKDFLGTDTFTYTIINASKLKDTATVTIQVYAAGDEFVPTSDTANVASMCGAFEDVLQTHKHDSIINVGGNTTIKGGDCTLNTHELTDSPGTGKKINCETGLASASGVESSALNIQYSNPPDTSAVTLLENNATTNVSVSKSVTLGESSYDQIGFTWTNPHIPLRVDFSNVQKINKIEFTTDNAVSFSTQAPYNLEIGSVSGNANSALRTTTLPKNIKIKTMALAGGSNVDFEATQTIQMDTAAFARDDSNISLKAKYVKLGSLTQNASGNNGRSYVTITADYIDIGTLSTGELATLVIKPYTPGKRILFRTNALSVSSTSTMIVYAGNYYTKAFNVPGTSDSSTIRAADATQLINFFFDGNFEPGNNPGINSNGNKGNYGTLPAANFVLFIKGDFNIGSGGTTFNATIYVEGSANIGTETAIKGALSAGGSISIGNNSEYIFDQSISASGWGACEITPIVVISNGLDAIDSLNEGYTAGKGLKTKIANKTNYTLDAVWLGTGTTPTSYAGTKSLPIRISLSNNACTTDENLSQSASYVAATIASGSSSVTSSSFQMIPRVKKVAKLRFRYIDWSALPGGDYSQCLDASSTLDALQGVPSCLNSDEKIEAAFGKDIATTCVKTGTKPACKSSSYANTLPSAPYDDALGCFICLADALNGPKCSTDTFAIRPNDFNSTLSENQQLIADKNTSITFMANQFANVGALDYNETMGTSFVVDVNISDATKTCEVPTLQFSPNIVFADGSISNTYSLPNVGDFNLTMREKSGSEYALTDADDTPDNERYITPYVQQINVVPAHFLIEGTFNNGSNGFTYLSNFEKYTTPADRNISSLLDLNITAQSDLDNTTSNYTALCYAKEGKVTLKTSTVGSTLQGLSALLWYDIRHDINGSVPLSNASSYAMDFNKTQFDNTAIKGMAEVKYRINFNRELNTTVEPFAFNVEDVNTSNEDNRTGTKALNQDATFYYGRVYSVDYRDVSPITTTIRYEAYCQTNCATHGLVTQSPLSMKWYHNPLHVNSDGNVSLFSSVGETRIGGANEAISGVIVGGIENNQLSLPNATPAPYTDRIRMQGSSWLIHNLFNTAATTNDFNVEFIKSGTWAGQGNLGQTVDVNASVRTNRRMEW